MPRRGENIYRRKDGRWEGRIWRDVGIPGKRSYFSVYGRTYKETKEKMELAREMHKPQSVRGMPSLGEACFIWLEDKKQYWKPTTLAAYRHVVEKHIAPSLGEVKIGNITYQILEEFASVMMRQEDALLSVNYLSYICAVIIRVLTHVKKKYGYDILIPDNPVMKNKRSPVMPPSEQALSRLEEYLIADSSRDMSLGILIAFYTGIRIGELCALTWGDMDLKDGIMYIRKNIQRIQESHQESCCDKRKTSTVIQTPKTADSVRIVPIPPILLQILLQHKQEASCYIISGMKNPWADPRTVQYQFQNILEKCGLEHFNFHMLRHAFASKCIAKGFDVKSLSEILGHSDIRLTMNLYVHSSMQQKKLLMSRLDTNLY